MHYLISRKYWNQGLMTEACACAVDFAFSVLRVVSIHSRHHIDNPASGRVLQKSGLVYTRTAYVQVADCEQISGDYHFYERTKH